MGKDDRDRDVRPAVFGDRSARARPAPWARSGEPEVRPWVPRGQDAEEPPSDEAPLEPPPGSQPYGPPAPEAEEDPATQPTPTAEHPDAAGGPQVPPAGPQDATVPPAADEPAELPEGPCQQCEVTREEAAAERDALLEALQDPYLRAAADLHRAADELSEGFHEAVIGLAVKLAGAIIQRGVSVDEEVMRANMRRALEVAGSVTSVTLRCHPDDAAAMRQSAPDLARETSGRPVDVTVRPSGDVEKGSCIVLFDEGIVDARWSQQLDRLADAVRTVVQTSGRGEGPAEPAGPGEATE